MFDLYRKRMALCGATIHDAILSHNQDVMNHCFANMTTYKKVRIDGQYYDARFIRNIDDSVEIPSGNYFIQFRNDQHFPIGTYIYIPDDNGEYIPWLLVSDKDDVQFKELYSEMQLYFTMDSQL